MSTPSPSIAVIGAGLSGLALALALSQQGLSATLYESRAAPLNIGGAIMLSPNALRILDTLGLYTKIASKGYSFQRLDWHDVVSDRVTERYEFGDATKYGYDGLRVYRHQLIDVLLEACREIGVKVVYGKKFAKVTEESQKGVIWAWVDGTTSSADILVGADGIHSTVRKHIYPDLVPKFTGMAGITAAVPTSQLQTPNGKLEHPITFTHPEAGAFVIAPQEVDGSEVLIGKQLKVDHELSRAEWDAVRADPEALVRFLQDGTQAFPEIAQNAASNIPHDKINVWPFYVVPKLDSWTSPKRRVLILGDAAHSIPPSAGQGINQAFEDVYMLASLLSAATKNEAGSDDAMTASLSFWQTFRQERVERVLALNRQIDLRRMPAGSVEGVQREEIELEWLYNADLDAVVEQWMESKGTGEEKAKEVAKEKARECPVHKALRKMRG